MIDMHQLLRCSVCCSRKHTHLSNDHVCIVLKCTHFKMSSISAFIDSPAGVPTQFKVGDKLYSFDHDLRSSIIPNICAVLCPNTAVAVVNDKQSLQLSYVTVH